MSGGRARVVGGECGSEHDQYRRFHPQLPNTNLEFERIPGSRRMYFYHARNQSKPVMVCRYLPCFCSTCRQEQYDICPFAHITGQVVAQGYRLLNKTKRRRLRSGHDSDSN